MPNQLLEVPKSHATSLLFAAKRWVHWHLSLGGEDAKPPVPGNRIHSRMRYCGSTMSSCRDKNGVTGPVAPFSLFRQCSSNSISSLSVVCPHSFTFPSYFAAGFGGGWGRATFHHSTIGHLEILDIL